MTPHSVGVDREKQKWQKEFGAYRVRARALLESKEAELAGLQARLRRAREASLTPGGSATAEDYLQLDSPRASRTTLHVLNSAEKGTQTDVLMRLAAAAAPAAVSADEAPKEAPADAPPTDGTRDAPGDESKTPTPAAPGTVHVPCAVPLQLRVHVCNLVCCGVLSR